MNSLKKLLFLTFGIILFSTNGYSQLTVKDLKKECKDLKDEFQADTLLIHKDISLEIKKDSKNLINYFCIQNKDHKKILTSNYEKNVKKDQNFKITFSLPLNQKITIKKNKEYLKLEERQEKEINDSKVKKNAKIANEKIDDLNNYLKNLEQDQDSFEKNAKEFLERYEVFKKLSAQKEIEFKNFISDLKSNVTADNKARWEEIEKRIKDLEQKLAKITDFKIKLEKNIKNKKDLKSEIIDRRDQIENDPKKTKFNDKYASKVKELVEESEKLDDDISKFTNSINNLEIDLADISQLTQKKEISLWDKYKFNLALIFLVIFLITSLVFVILYLSSLRKVNELKDFQDKLLDQIDQLKKSSSQQISDLATNISRSAQSFRGSTSRISETKSTPLSQINPYDEMMSDYINTLDNFDLAGQFQSKWKAKGFSRKERQDGGKTAIIPSQRAFEKAEIWVVDLKDQSVALTGVAVKQNMSTYMNLDYEKANRDFRGIFDVSSASSFTCRKPAVVTQSGPSYFIVQKGIIEFPG